MKQQKEKTSFKDAMKIALVINLIFLLVIVMDILIGDVLEIYQPLLPYWVYVAFAVTVGTMAFFVKWKEDIAVRTLLGLKERYMDWRKWR